MLRGGFSFWESSGLSYECLFGLSRKQYAGFSSYGAERCFAIDVRGTLPWSNPTFWGALEQILQTVKLLQLWNEPHLSQYMGG
jgi:hypothetical protein